MASTSLAEQLKKLAAPQTSLLIQKKKKPSLLFNPSEAASIDRSTFYEIGISGLKELIEINSEFEDFKFSLFDETSKNFERTIESHDVNEKLNSIIKKFLYSLSPYFLLKPTQKVLEWLINRFYIHEYNVDELLCAALPYHGTRLFARLIQVFDLKNSHQKWQWLYPIQKKGVPLSKNALFNHCASDVAFLKMICELTMEAVDIFGTNASKLTTLFGFYSTTVVGAIQNMPELNELHLTHMLPSIFRGLTSDCVDFTASVLIIIAAIFAKVSFQDRMHRKLVEKITKVQHSSLHKSVILLLNILYQAQDENEASIPSKALKNIFRNSDWFVLNFADFISSGNYPNTFYLVLVRDSLRSLQSPNTDENEVQTFVGDLLSSCRLDDICAEKLIRLVINEVKDRANHWDCELVKNLERQYPTAWDNVVSTLFKEYPSESLSRILGFTSITSQVQTFEKLNHVNSVVRIEAIKYIAENPDAVKIKYIKNSLIARWNDENPEVIEAMFLLPKNMRFCSNEIIDQLLLRCWRESGENWDSLLLRVIEAMNNECDLKNNLAKYTVLLLPFLISSPTNIKSSILKVDLPFFKSLGNVKNNANVIINDKIINKSILPSFEELTNAYKELPKENVYVFTFLLLLSGVYASSKDENKAEILTFFSEEIFTDLKKFKWKISHTWNESSIEEYYKKTKSGKFPRQIVYKFFASAIEHTSIPQHFSSLGWWDFSDDHSNLVSVLYIYMNTNFQFTDDMGINSFVFSFINKHFDELSKKITFLCNMCVQHRADVSVQCSTFKMINILLKDSFESYPWALSMNADNVLVPCILIFSSSKKSELRSLVMDTIEIITMSIGSILIPDISYLELLKYLLRYKEEIILDENQMPAKAYEFLSQDDAVQSLLPASVRCLTKTVLDGVIKHITDTKTPLSVSARLMITLEYLRDTNTVEKLVSYVNTLLKISNYPNNEASLIVCNVIDKFHANDMKMYKKVIISDFIKYCLRNGSEIKIRTESGVCCVNALILRKLAVDIFDKMGKDMKNIILDAVLKICAKCDNVDLISAANSFVKKITLNCELLVSHLENMKNAGVDKKNKRKSTETLVPNVLQSMDWKCGIALLELIQNKKKLYDCHLIMPLLFDILQKCCEIDDQMAVEYVKQVCLSCALNCSQKLISENHADIEKLFNVELVVNCIRMSPNPQTHHHALMLLAHCATFAPNRVLHNIMAIFTFMGSSILRQDDAFSFQIISNILETIVPLLVQKTDDLGNLSASSITSVLRVFASSIPDIPDHRRIPLLMKLMKILQDGEYLHVLLILTLECCTKCSVNNKTASTKYTEVMQELCLSLPVHVTLSCFYKLMSFVNALPLSTEEKLSEKLKSFNDLIDLKKYSNKELCHFNYIMLNFISTVLSNSAFINRVTFLGKTELNSLEDYFKGIIEQTLLYVKSVTEYSSNVKNASAKYWKVIISQSLEILNKTNALLTNETFLSVTRELLNHDCLTVQRKTMETLNWRLQQSKEDATKEHFSPDELISLLPPLMKIVETIWKNSEDDSFDSKFNQQIALISIKLITRYSGSADYSENFKEILSKLTAAMYDNVKMNDHVMACMILCVAELMSSLRIRAIESLPNFMPKFLQLFERYQKEEIAQSDVILLSIITALQKIIEIIPNFLSPYMETILYEVCCLTERICENEATKQKKSDDSKQSNISHKLKLIRQKMSSDVPSRVLLPATSSCFTKLCENSNFSGIKHLMDILAESFPNNGQFSVELTSLFLNVLDFRCTSDVSNEVIDQIEIYVIEALCKIVLKCSESTFRPFYHKLYDWGVIASKDISKKDRIITYYKILSKMSEKLKSIFVIFASNFIRNAVELLDKNNIGKCEGDPSKMYYPDDLNKTVPLVDSILITFHNIFKYDTIKFMTKDRFNMLVEPLVNQAENTIGDFEKRSSEIIVPCLSRFAAATSDDSLWKQFNYSILLKTRHYSPEVRLTALETVCMFATQLGDNFLPFLPETVPFLAELLEDENEIVEKRTHKVVQKLEQVLDEPIQKYF